MESGGGGTMKMYDALRIGIDVGCIGRGQG